MIPDETLKARLHLFAVLPLLEEVARDDPRAQEIVRGVRGVIQLGLPGMAAQVELLGQGVAVHRGRPRPPDVSLFFPAPLFLNNLFESRWPVLLLPLRGAWRWRLMHRFVQLAQRLTHYLKPAATPLSPAERNLATTLMLYVGILGAAEVGRSEHGPGAPPSRIPDGTFQVAVKGGPSIHLVKQGHTFFAQRGEPERANAYLGFCDFDVAHRMLTGKLDHLAAIGLGDIEVKGSLMAIEELSLLMEKTERILA